MDAFREYLTGEGLSSKSIRVYVQAVERAEAWMRRHHTSVQWAGPVQLAEYGETLVNTYATRRTASVAFKHYWEMCGRDNPPIKALRVPPQPQMECRALEPTETRDLVKVALGWWPKGTMVLFGLYLGLRRLEIAKAEWERFSPDMDWYRVTGKFDKTATLPVHPILKSELEGQRGKGWVFPGRWGGPSNPATVWSYCKQVALKAGIEDFTTHQLRHTVLATANDNTGDLRAVQTFARHSKPSTTAGYTRTTKTRLRDISDSLDYL